MEPAVEVIEDITQDDATTGMDDVLKEVESLEVVDEEKEVEKEVEVDEDKEIETEEEKEVETEVEIKIPEQTEISELRQILREQKREIAEMRAAQTEDLDSDGNRIPTDTEILQSEISTIITEKGGMIDLMAESMREMPKYNDLDSVCSRSNLDDIIEVIAKELETSDGVDFNAAVLSIEKDIWSMPNPYKYIYETIKEFHPAYGEKEEKEEKKKEIRDLTAVTTMQSTQDASGDNDIKGGWTADKIDKLSEDELNSVPANVYKKYMQGELK